MCPSNLGASLQATVALKLNNTRRLLEICDKYGLSHAQENDDVVTISNRSAFGSTEYECIKRVWDGVAEIISEQLVSLQHDQPANEAKNENDDEEKQLSELVETGDVDDGAVDASSGKHTPAEEADKIDDASFVISRDVEEPRDDGDDVMPETESGVQMPVDETEDDEANVDAEPEADITAEEAIEA